MTGTETVETPASEVVVDKKFADLTNEEIHSMNDEEATPYAIQQGWKSPENFNGDKSKAKTAKQYLTDTFDEMPVLRSNLKKQTAKVEELGESLRKNTKFWDDKMAKQEARHKKELEKKIATAEKTIAKAKTDFDVEAVAEATQDKVEFQNELKEAEVEATQREAQAKQSDQQKIKEWESWRGSKEADDLYLSDPARFIGLEKFAGDIYAQNKDLSTSEIIKLAKERAYPNKTQAPNLQSANPSVTTKAKASKLTQDDKDVIKLNVDEECNFKKRKGLAGDALKKYRKERFAYYEKRLTEGDE